MSGVKTYFNGYSSAALEIELLELLEDAGGPKQFLNYTVVIICWIFGNVQ